MNFIISGLSMNMFLDKNFDLQVNEIGEEEFMALAENGVSYIGQKDIADILGFAHNREQIQVRIGDNLLLAQTYRKGVLRFYCIRIVEPLAPIYTEEEVYIHEEMI